LYDANPPMADNAWRMIPITCSCFILFQFSDNYYRNQQPKCSTCDQYRPPALALLRLHYNGALYNGRITQYKPLYDRISL
jgi:hypothetical protein